MSAKEENMQAVGDYARHKMMETKITGGAIVALVLFVCWFLHA